MLNFNRKMLLLLLIAGALLLSVISSPMYATPYRSYTYDYWGNPQPAPQAYYPSRVISGRDLGVGELNNPRDIFVSKRGIYLVDTGNNRIIVLDHNWQTVNIIKEFYSNGEKDRFNFPAGVYVTEEETLYVADRNNSRIVIFAEDGSFKREIGSPQLEGVIRDDFRYRPYKIGVDRAGRMYVLAQEVYDGFMEFDVDGNFRGFIGAPRVTPNVIDYIWREFSTEERRERLALFLPVEYSNLDIDDRGFIYATVTGGAGRDKEPIRRLNPTGMDVLRRMGFHPPVGDYGTEIGMRDEEGEWIEVPSRFVDIAAHDYGLYSVLDRTRGRIFTYDSNGNLLYVFGGRGYVRGTFQLPSALAVMGREKIVLDRRLNRITVFEPTLYAEMIFSAIEYYQHGNYDMSADMWREVLRLNANYEMAYSGIGRTLLRQDYYQDAMKMFRLGQDRQGFSEAFRLYRQEVISRYFGWIVTLPLFIILLISLGNRLNVFTQLQSLFGRKVVNASVQATGSEGIIVSDIDLVAKVYRLFKRLSYALHVVVHPFDGFWDLKHEKRGSVLSASIILVMLVLTLIFMRLYTGFLFNPVDLRELNYFLEITGLLLPLGLWCMVNWALTTLLEGKGTAQDIYITTVYALTPVILINIPLTIVSNYITFDEGTFYYLMLSMSLMWGLVLLFFGTMIVHDYNVTKTLLTSILTLIGMGIIIFMGLLFLSVIDRMVDFFRVIYLELSVR